MLAPLSLERDMPLAIAHEVVWLDADHRIIWQAYRGQLRLDETLPVLERCATFIRMENHPVDVILDVRTLPIHQMREFFAIVRYLTSKVPLNQRHIVVCADRLFIDALANATSSLAMKTLATLRFFTTLDEAVRDLRQRAFESSC
jgi:hypothetical protein